MTDWGVPDWQDADSYPAFETWTLQRWHWEFIRREPDYREQAMAFLDRMEKGWGRNDQSLAFQSYFARWGYCDIVLDPRRSDYSDDQLKRLRLDAVAIAIGSPHSRMELQKGQAAIRIDLTKPLEPQFELARRAARQAQIDAEGGLIDERERRDKWPSYLRTLDARTAGASWREIGATLSPFTAQSIGTARQTHKAAMTLQNRIAA